MEGARKSIKIWFAKITPGNLNRCLCRLIVAVFSYRKAPRNLLCISPRNSICREYWKRKYYNCHFCSLRDRAHHKYSKRSPLWQSITPHPRCFRIQEEEENDYQEPNLITWCVPRSAIWAATRVLRFTMVISTTPSQQRLLRHGVKGELCKGDFWFKKMNWLCNDKKTDAFPVREWLQFFA